MACEDPKDMICYAFEVRKQDAEQEMKGKRPKDFFTEVLLGKVEMDKVLRTIIYSNHWVHN